MSSVRSARGLRACLAFGAFACALVLGFEASRRSATKSWFELSAGLGLGSQAGVEDGWFAYDARLESLDDADFAAPPDSALGAGRGVFTLAPIAH